MIFKIPVDVYRTVVFVMVDVTDEQARALCKREGVLLENLKGMDLPDWAAGVTLCDDTTRLAFVRLQSDSPPEVVAHEFLHAAFWLLHSTGMLLDASSEEAYCYLLSYLIEEYHKKIKPRNS